MTTPKDNHAPQRTNPARQAGDSLVQETADGILTSQSGQAILKIQPPAQPECFINKAATAQRLRKTQRSIDNWMKLGILPYYKIGRSVLFKWSEVESHLAATCRVSRPN